MITCIDPECDCTDFMPAIVLVEQAEMLKLVLNFLPAPGDRVQQYIERMNRLGDDIQTLNHLYEISEDGDFPVLV